jgi:outer membrane autotransporter protein
MRTNPSVTAAQWLFGYEMHSILRELRRGAVTVRLVAIAALCLHLPSVAFANCVLQPDGSTVICDTSPPNPFTSSINANPTTGGTITIPTTGATVTVEPGAAISSSGAAIQVRDMSTVTNSGSVSTSLINGYGIWAGDPTNSTSTTAGYGDTLQNNGSIVTTGPNGVGLFARSYNKTMGDTLINNGTIMTSGTISGTSNNVSSAGIRSETVAPSTILNTGTVTATGAYKTIGLYGVGGDGVEMDGPGMFTNTAGASVSSTNAYGFYGNGAMASGITVDNAGTISGGRAAILFGPGLSNNTVILEPTSVENGTIDGGSGSINSSLIFNGLNSNAFANPIPDWQLVMLQSGANVTFTASSYALQNLSLATGTAATFSTPQISISGTVTDNGALTFASPNAISIAATIVGSGTLTQDGTGVLTLSGPNAYTGTTTVETGTLAAGATNTLPSLTAVTVEAPGTLNLAGFNQSIGSLAGAGSVSLGTATLTTGNDNTNTLFSGDMSGSGALNKVGTGTFILSGANTYTGGTTISAGTLQLGDGTINGSIVGKITDNATLASDPAAGTTIIISGVISGSGVVNEIGPGTTVLAANDTDSGQTNVEAGTLAAGGENDFSPNSVSIVDPGATLDLRGFDQEVAGVDNAGTIFTHGDPNTQLIVDGSYVGNNGRLVLNTILGGDDSPSDKLVLNGGTATGRTELEIHNVVEGMGAETFRNGIPVVVALNGATTAPNAFELTGEVRDGAFDYDLFRGGVEGTNPQDFFLRNSFAVGEPPPEPPFVPEPGEQPPPGKPGTAPPSVPDGVPDPPEPGQEPGAGLPVIPTNPFPTDPPLFPLPPGIYPVIGPELATEGVVQPIARQMGFEMLGTLHERIGDTLTIENAGPDAEGWGRSGWARFFGQQIDNKYEAYADPSVNGRLFGVQAGFDILRASFIPGHRDVAGVYFAYGNSEMDVNGLVTNAAANGYVFTRTGTLNLYGYSGGAYWTHYGPSGWYVDAVFQGTVYNGNATTQDANLPTNGSGIITSLEVGYPIPIPLSVVPRFILEPQGQILWQHTSFRQAFDGLSEVGLGSTSGATGRLGLRAQSSIITQNGQVWQPYVRANLWQNWGGASTTSFAGDQVPLLQESTQLEFAGGVTYKYSPLLSFYAQAGYEFAVGGDTDGGKRQGVKGDIGLRLTFGAPPPPPPAPAAMPAPAAARSYLVFFDWDKATLTDRARQIIREAAANSTHVQYTRIEVNGYTDTSGMPKYNQGLSVRRAQAVAGELVRDGVPASAISIRGFGDTHLLVPTDPGVREPQNRRVEIVIS